MKIGFVGLGLMGLPIAQHLLAAGHTLFVSSANHAALRALTEAGAQPRDTPAQVAAEAEAFFSCRVTPDHSVETFLGPQGVRGAGPRGLLCVDLSTIDPQTSRHIGAELARKGMRFLDAPISGGPDGARAKTLSVIVGGTVEDVAAAEPLLVLFGKAVFHMGPVGAGVTAKLCNNMITITTHVLLAEAMVLGVKAGIDPRRLYDMLRASSASSRTLERVVPAHFLKRDFAPAGSIDVVLKDLECALDEGRRLGVPLHLPTVALEAVLKAAEAGHGQLDVASVILPIEAIAGVQVGPA